MSNRWFASVATDEVEIQIDGEPVKLWLKQELSEGEGRAVETAGFEAVSGFGRRGHAEEANPEIRVNWERQSFQRSLAYLHDWSLADDANNKIKITLDTLKSLRRSVYASIETAINEHIERRKAVQGNGEVSPIANVGHG